MLNIEIYNQVFSKNFNVDEEQINTLTYRSISAWDSVGHMSLIASMEEAFSLFFETNDIIDFSSYEAGKQILRKYNVDI